MKAENNLEQVAFHNSPIGRYTLFGIAFGFCFPVFAIFFDLSIHLDRAITLKNILELHRVNPIHYVIDSAPLFLGLAFGIAGYYQNSVMELNRSIRIANAELKEKNEILEKTLKDLHSTREKSVRNEKLAAFGIMANRVSHELQNPLNLINNFSDLTIELVEEFKSAEDSKDKEKAASLVIKNVEKIHQHGKRAEDIIRQLQEYARAGTAHEFFEE